MLSALQPNFVGIGHVSFDVIVGPNGRAAAPEPGGAAMFGARTAAGLSLNAGVITAAHDDYPFGRVGRGVPVRQRRTAHTTTFEATHDGRHRRHRLVASAGPMTEADVPPDWSRPEVLLAAPLAGELPPGCAEWFESQISCAIAQGWMRRWREDGEEFIEPSPPPGLAGLDIVVVSDAEVPDELIPAWRSTCQVLAVTRGEAGVSIFEGDRRIDVAGFPAEVVDTTGAGDVWAAAFAIRLLETGETEHSARFANAAASLSVEKVGLSGIPTRGDIEQRLGGL